MGNWKLDDQTNTAYSGVPEIDIFLRKSTLLTFHYNINIKLN